MNVSIPYLFSVVGAMLLLSGCGTTVTLVPDESGEVGRAVVTGSDGREMALTTARESAKVSLGHVRSARYEGDDAFQASLQALPEAAASFVLHFDSDSTALSPAALAVVEKALAFYADRNNARVMVIGHTDRAGDKNVNERLALERAEVAAKKLRDAGVGDHAVRVEGFGTKQPLVPENPSGHTPENRRVEIYIW